MVVTHRIVDIGYSAGVYTFTMAGDAIADDPTNSSVQVVTSDSGDIIGKVTGVSLWMGQLVLFLSQWYGKLLLILIPCTIIIAFELRKIIRLVRGSRSEGADCSETEEHA